MSDPQAELGRNLLQSLARLKTEKGRLSLQDVGGIFMKLAQACPAEQSLHEEIHRLASYISDAKKEIFAIASNEKSEAVITDASQHLDEVIKATEEASHTIMDAADAIQNAAAGIGGEAEQKIMEATSSIYTACNFQDITGQRITKVINLLVNIEDRVSKLNALFGTANDNEAATANAPLTDKDLLNGPQLAGQASSQDDIDKLFASLGGN